jgi:hypothetical protein
MDQGEYVDEGATGEVQTIPATDRRFKSRRSSTHPEKMFALKTILPEHEAAAKRERVFLQNVQKHPLHP